MTNKEDLGADFRLHGAVEGTAGEVVVEDEVEDACGMDAVGMDFAFRTPATGALSARMPSRTKPAALPNARGPLAMPPPRGAASAVGDGAWREGDEGRHGR